MRHEHPWEYGAVQAYIPCHKIPPQALKTLTEDPLSPLQHLTEALSELRLQQAKEGDR